MKKGVLCVWAGFLLGCSVVARAESTATIPVPPAEPEMEVAIFAGGNFWSMEQPFDHLPGVVKTQLGYIGGHQGQPSHIIVTGGSSGHFEAVRITYRSTQVTYEQLLDTFWRNIDPFNKNGQFCEKGEPYLSVVFYSNRSQQVAAETSIETTIKKRWPHKELATQVLPATEFFLANDYHQNFYQKHPKRYKYFSAGCGRRERLNILWGQAKD